MAHDNIILGLRLTTTAALTCPVANHYRAPSAACSISTISRTIVAIDDSFDNAEKVGLHLVGREAA